MVPPRNRNGRPSSFIALLGSVAQGRPPLPSLASRKVDHDRSRASPFDSTGAHERPAPTAATVPPPRFRGKPLKKRDPFRATAGTVAP